MIDELALIKELEEWKARCDVAPAGEVAEVMIMLFIEKVKSFPKVCMNNECVYQETGKDCAAKEGCAGYTYDPEWKASMLRKFTKVE